MSQAKVDKYKKEKKPIVKRDGKAENGKNHWYHLWMCNFSCHRWMVGYTGYNYYEDNKPAQTYYTNTSALSSYVSGLNTEAQ